MEHELSLCLSTSHTCDGARVFLVPGHESLRAWVQAASLRLTGARARPDFCGCLSYTRARALVALVSEHESNKGLSTARRVQEHVLSWCRSPTHKCAGQQLALVPEHAGQNCCAAQLHWFLSWSAPSA